MLRKLQVPQKKIVRKVVTVDEYVRIRLSKLPAEPDDVKKLHLLVVKEETAKSAWNKMLPVPLEVGEVVVVVSDVIDGQYVKVFHGQHQKVKSIFAIHHFTRKDGGEIYFKPKSHYVNRILLESGKKRIEPIQITLNKHVVKRVRVHK